MKGTLKDLLSITLPHRAFAACVSFVAGLAQGGGLQPSIIVFGLMSIVITYSSQAVFNNIKDIESDRVNSPDRPLARGAISERSAWALLATLTALGFVFAYLASPALAAVNVLYVLLGVIYSAFAKSRWYLSYLTLTTTHYVLPFCSGYLLFGVPNMRFLWIIVFIAVSEVLAVSLKDYKDVPGDKRVGLKTLPISFSTENAAMITFVGLCLPLMLVWLPWLVLKLSIPFLALYLVAGTVRFSLGLELLGNPGPEAAGRILKVFRYIVLLQLFGWWIT